jgi:hypothetical protein
LEKTGMAITKVHNIGRKDAPELGATNGLEVQVVDVELGRRSRVHRDIGQRAVRPA